MYSSRYITAVGTDQTVWQSNGNGQANQQWRLIQTSP
jgi:hypothetical protein